MTGKKSKYRHAVINKKKYYFYSIRWLDITGDAGHATIEEFDKFGCAIMITQAYVYKKTINSYGRFLLMMRKKKYLVIEMYFQKGV